MLRLIIQSGAFTQKQAYEVKLNDSSSVRTIPLKLNNTPSVRTICPGEGCREHPKKQKSRCGNDSVAAAFLWPESKKALKSRAFGQNEKVGNFYQNYLPFVDLFHRFDRIFRRGVHRLFRGVQIAKEIQRFLPSPPAQCNLSFLPL